MKLLDISLFFIVLLFFCLWSIPLHALDVKEIENVIFGKPQKTVSMDFKDASLSDVLKIFSQQSGMNFIASDSISSIKINLYFEDVPIEDALEQILSANDLTYEHQSGSNIFKVIKIKFPERDVITRVYPLKHSSVSSSKIFSTLSSSSDSSTEASTASAGIKAAVEAILTDDGKINEDVRTNSLVVTDIPTNFQLIENTIARLDVPIPQILIEVEMLDISKDVSDQIGVKFGSTPISFSGASKEVLAPFDHQQALLVSDDSEGEGPYTTKGLLDYTGLKAALDFLRTQTDTQNLARPRILTLNNETAVIQIKTDEAIGVVDTTSDSGSSSESVQEAERAETGVFLTVTPQANLETNEIIMAIEPRVVQAVSSAGFTNADQFKDTEERGTKSILKIQNGDTVILGGLLRTKVSNVNTRLPVLGEIPVLKKLFSHTDKSHNQRELVIFLTPHILDINTQEVLSKKQDFPQFQREQTFLNSDEQEYEINRTLNQLEQYGF